MPKKPYPLIIQRDEEKLNSNLLQLQGLGSQPRPILHQYSITENGTMQAADSNALPSSSQSSASADEKLKKSPDEKTYWLLSEVQRVKVNERRAQLRKEKIPFYKFARTRSSQENPRAATQDFVLDRSVLICHDKAYVLYSGKESLVGKTNKSKVKLAQDLDTGEWVALKIMDMPKVLKDSSLKTVNSIISREAEVLERAGQLHGYISRLQHEQESSTKKRYLLSELFAAQGGSTLFDQLYGIRTNAGQQKNEISLENKLKMAISVLESIEALHEKDIIHRDIKSLNIIWDTQKSKAQIIDMGISFILSENEKCGQFFPRINACGTPGYMAPELHDYENYCQTLSPYFYERLGHDSQLVQQSLNPYQVKTVANLYEIHPESDQVKATIENFENWYAFQLYESQFPLILKLVQSEPKSKWIKKTKTDEDSASNREKAHQITLAITKGLMAQALNQLDTKKYQDNNKLYEYYDDLESALKSLGAPETFKLALEQEWYPKADTNQNFKPNAQDFEKMANIHQKMEWVLMCADPIYSFASDTFATGHVLAEIFTQNTHSHNPNRPSTDLSEFNDILSPPATIEEPLKSIFRTIKSMVDLNPYGRITIKNAKEQLQNSLKAVIESEKNQKKSYENPNNDYAQTFFQQKINEHYDTFFQLGDPRKQITLNSTIEKDKGLFLNHKPGGVMLNSNSKTNAEIALRVTLALKDIRLDSKLISNTELLNITKTINNLYINYLEMNADLTSQQLQQAPIRKNLEELMKTMVTYLEYKGLLDNKHRAVFNAHI